MAKRVYKQVELTTEAKASIARSQLMTARDMLARAEQALARRIAVPFTAQQLADRDFASHEDHIAHLTRRVERERAEVAMHEANVAALSA